MNKKFLEKILYGFLALGILGVLYVFYLETHKVEFARSRQLASLLFDEVPLTLQERTKEENCEPRGFLPDPECTPGAIFEKATLEEICTSGYTKKVRNVSTKTRKKVYAMYNIHYPVPTGSYELDHFIPLALGGNNDIANLFPESAKPSPGFKEKDVVEVYLYQEVCAKRIDLSAAQSQIVKDWVMIYNNLSPETISAIKNKYKSWSN